jgi:hypothetical protein
MSKRSHSHTGPNMTNSAKCKKTGKTRYIDRIRADLVLENIQLRSRREIRDEKRSYRCSFCGGYHLTSQDRLTELPYSA